MSETESSSEGTPTEAIDGLSCSEGRTGLLETTGISAPAKSKGGGKRLNSVRDHFLACKVVMRACAFRFSSRFSVSTQALC